MCSCTLQQLQILARLVFLAKSPVEKRSLQGTVKVEASLQQKRSELDSAFIRSHCRTIRW